MKPTFPRSLNALLKRTSRSFYLSLRVLPSGMREPLAIAYLLARAADTIADTRIVPSGRRRNALITLRNTILTGSNTDQDKLRDFPRDEENRAERDLLDALPEVLAFAHTLAQEDRDAVRKVLETLTDGMLYDLERFPDEATGKITALEREADLECYTYLVAGCVGEFWTEMTCTHVEAMRSADREHLSRLGIRFGQALQMVNILRDLPRDLRIGRCYVPQSLLTKCALEPHQLMQSEYADRSLPAIRLLTRRALDDFRCAVDYTLSLPADHLRLRLACLWPIVIGLETLLAHMRNERRMSPEYVSRISRRQVYGIMVLSLFRAGSNEAVRNWTNGLIKEIETRLPPESIVPPASLG